MVSSNFLAYVIIASILITALTTFYVSNQLNDYPNTIVGKQSSDLGNVSFTIEQTASIILNIDSINFGSGFVNTSPTNCTNNATLTAAETYDDSLGNDCWTDNTALPTSFLLENNGNINVSVNVTGPSEIDFFNNYAGSNPYNITWLSRNNESNACGSGLLQNSSYTTFGGVSKQVCGSLKFGPVSEDEIGINVKVVIPDGLNAGTYENTTIEFTAAPN